MTPPSEIQDILATEFALEVKSRQRDRTLQALRLLSFIVMVMLVGASFIPDLILRRLVGFGLLGLLCGLQGWIWSVMYIHGLRIGVGRPKIRGMK